MRKLIKFFNPLIPIALLILISCASTKFVSVFKDEGYEGGNIKSVLVVGVSENQINRRLFEDTFTAQFKKKGIDAVPSYTVIATSKGLNKETVLSEAEKLGTNTILATNLLDVQEEYIYYNPLDYDLVTRRHTLGSYFQAATDYAHSPVSYSKIEQVRLQTNLYERETQKLIWSAVSETFRPESVTEVIDSLCSAIMNNLKQNNLIGH